MAEKKKGTFSLEKILTISAIEYCTMMGRSLNDYVAEGFIYYIHDCDAPNTIINNVSSKAEVIVGLKISGAGCDSYSTDFYVYGTALIPKTG